MTRIKEIQETAQEQKYDMPPGLAHSPPGGLYVCYETDEKYTEERMKEKENRTEWAVLFDMVAEPAMWQAELAIWFA
eukprot:3660017-Amphidinium_carterae.1